MTQSSEHGTLIIRPMNDGEIEEVVALWQSCGLARPWNDPAHDIAFARLSGDADILVGLSGERIVASVMTGHDGHRGAAYYVAVHPDCRGAGHGGTMMSAAENWCLARGIWKMNIMVRDDNAAALGFYEKLGYAPGGTTQLGKWIDPTRTPDKD